MRSTTLLILFMIGSSSSLVAKPYLIEVAEVMDEVQEDARRCGLATKPVFIRFEPIRYNPYNTTCAYTIVGTGYITINSAELWRCKLDAVLRHEYMHVQGYSHKTWELAQVFNKKYDQCFDGGYHIW